MHWIRTPRNSWRRRERPSTSWPALRLVFVLHAACDKIRGPRLAPRHFQELM